MPSSSNLAVNWTASTLRVPAASYFETLGCSMNRCIEVIESFEITGRGLVVVLPVMASDLPHATPLPVTVHAPGQLPFHAQAFHEILLRRSTATLESSALLLSGLGKFQVPIGSILEFESNAA